MSGREPTTLSIKPATLLFAARALRDFGDGFVAVLLPVYLLSRGLTPFEVGVVSTASLLGSALLTLCVGAVGARFDGRRLLIAAAGLMTATGVAFALIDGYALLLVVAFAGTVNPSGGASSVFAPLEQAALAAEAPAAGRTKMFATYSLVGALAGAAGALFAAVPDFVAAAGIAQARAIDAMFVVYAALGVAGGVLYSRIPARGEAHRQAPRAPLGPSRGIVLRLAVLFSLDSFAGGFVVQSLLALWLFERFDLSLAEAGAFFFWTGVLSAFSFPVAAWLAARIGLVNTMVFTHIPASVALMLAAVAPSLPVVLVLLSVRAALSQMDVPTRTSYVMAVVTEPERAAAASFTAVPRSLAASVSPAIAGAMFAASLPALPLLVCGFLKIAYDLLLLRQFRHVRPPEES
ncbi:MAG: MFS transporter [Rhodospirillales bacterium]|nr:MFS transporter [Rhodospirillales bacterium]